MANLTRLYRLANGVNHFYTTDEAERESANVKALGFNDEGIACYVYASEVDGTVPLYRLANGANHFYTTDKAESDAVQRLLGFNYEGIACYVYSSKVDGTVPLFRLSNGANHLYTTSQAERDSVRTQGWNYDGDACYVVSSSLTWLPYYSHITYAKEEGFPTHKELLESVTIDNPFDNVTMTKHVTLAKELTCTYEWELTSTLSVGAGVSWDLPVLGLGGSVNVQLDLGSREAWTKSETVSYSITDTLEVRPGPPVVLSGWVNWADNISTGFTLEVRMQVNGDGVPLTADQISDLMQLLNPEVTVEPSGPNEVIARFSGTFSGSLGLDTYIGPVAPVAPAQAAHT